MTDIITQGLIDLGLNHKVPPDAPDRLSLFGALLLEKNKVMNLTAIREEARVARLHMLDCAALLNWADFQGKTLIDVGTGAGFPGLALRILVPSLEVTLLDSLGKRVDWLEEVSARLGLTGVRALHARAEELAHKKGFRDSFDFAAARAVAELRVLCELCLPFVRVGGSFLAMKGPDSDGEIAAAEAAINRLGGRLKAAEDYRIPGTKITHRLVLVEKASPTPRGYPRRWAKLQNDPL